jgi:hypothetical protein
MIVLYISYSEDASWTASLWLKAKMAVFQDPDHPCVEHYQTQIGARSITIYTISLTHTIEGDQ